MGIGTGMGMDIGTGMGMVLSVDTGMGIGLGHRINCANRHRSVEYMT